MINADKYKKNKFRKLVPTSNSDTDKLQKLTTVDYQNEQTNSHLTISQQIQKSISKIGVEGVSQRYKDKHFVFQRRLKTISSMNEKRQQTIKQINSLATQYKIEQEPQTSKYSSILSLIEQFKQKSQQISKAKSLEQLNSVAIHNQIQTQEQIQLKYDCLIEKSKQSSLKLISIYLQRHISNKIKYAFKMISKFPQQITFQTADIIQQKHQQKRQPINNCRNNLLNVSKFFGSI